MSYKNTGTAAKSVSGASMSNYDVELEERLKKLEAVVSALERSVDECKANCAGNTGGDVESKLERLVAVLKQTPSLGLDQYDNS
jgi:tetrahydromethanopterin S-methyltransferase subunit B